MPVEKAGRGGFCVRTDEYDARLLGQPGQHVGKKAFGIDRRAQVAHVAHEDRVEIIQKLRPAPHDLKPRTLGLAHLVADLDAHASPHVVLASVQRQDHGHLMPLGRQGQADLSRVPQFHMPSAKTGTQILSGLQQGLGRCLVAGQKAAVRHKRQGNQKIAEEQALHVHQGQDAAQGPLLRGCQIVRHMPEAAFQDAAPGEIMVAAGARHRGDKSIPLARIALERFDAHAHASTPSTSEPVTQGEALPSNPSTSLMVPNSRPLNRKRNLSSVRSRLT